jgi:hypothetical protein
MKKISLICILALLTIISCFAFANTDKGKKITLTNSSGIVEVPKGRIWKIDGLSPYVSEKGVGTADIYIDGEIMVGKSRDYTIYGKFDISINKPQQFPLWVLSGAKVSIGDSRQKVVITEHKGN